MDCTGQQKIRIGIKKRRHMNVAERGGVITTKKDVKRVLSWYDPHNRNRRSPPDHVQHPRHQYTRRIVVSGDYKLHHFMDMNTPDTEEKSPQQEWLDRAKEDIDTNLKHMNNQPIFNTPDTEGEAYGRGYKQGRFDSEMDRLNEGPATPETNYCDSMTPEEREAQSKIKVTYTTSNTPDTELKKHAQRADYFEPDTLVMTLDNIDLLLTYRDTYWKERVLKDVKDAYEHAEIVRQRTLNEIRQAVEDDESYGGAKECVYKILDRY